MTPVTHKVIEQAKRLSDVEKLDLVNELLLQLDRPDPEIDRVWAEEARARWKAYQEGAAPSVSYAEAMAKYRKQ